jgi:hypothetical protein
MAIASRAARCESVIQKTSKPRRSASWAAWITCGAGTFGAKRTPKRMLVILTVRR